MSPMPAIERVVLIVLDSCGVGGAPDAARFGDAGADTLGNTARAVGGLTLPHLEALGLGCLSEIAGVARVSQPEASYGRLRERSVGKDTTTGHWELAGMVTHEPFATFPQGFPEAVMRAFTARTGRAVLGNLPASGTEILDVLGPEQLRTGAWIVYTSADSVFQIAAHEAHIPLTELYGACVVARDLCNPLRVGRIIARPYLGKPGAFLRTYNRRDYGMPPPAPTVLDRLQAASIPVVAIGKIGDIFSERGIATSLHTAGNADGIEKTIAALSTTPRGLIFVNLIDFDFLYGHRRDAPGFARALSDFDQALPRIVAALSPKDLLILTADHGNDPTFPGTDHTREEVPLLVYRPGAPGQALGVRESFADVAETVATVLGLGPQGWGTPFMPREYPGER